MGKYNWAEMMEMVDRYVDASVTLARMTPEEARGIDTFPLREERRKALMALERAIWELAHPGSKQGGWSAC